MGQSNYEKGIIYEQLTRDLVEKYLKEISLGGKVEWDVTLKGLSGATHQIDVLITHDDGISIIECKNYDSNVCQEKLQSFSTVRDDLKEYNVKNSYFFTKTGFQIGAIKIAKAYNINIKNLKEYDRNDDYAQGRIKNIKATLDLLVITKFQYKIFDKYNNEITGQSFFDGDMQYHRSDLYNYFGARCGLRISDEGSYSGEFKDLSQYNMKDNDSGRIVDSFIYDVTYKTKKEELFEINDNLTTHVIIDKENNKIQFIDKQYGVIEKKLKNDK